MTDYEQAYRDLRAGVEAHVPVAAQGQVWCSIAECDWTEDGGISWAEHVLLASSAPATASEQLDQNQDKQGAAGVRVGELGGVALGVTLREGDGEMVGGEDGEGERLVHRLHVCGTPSSAPHATDRAGLAEVLADLGLDDGLRPTPTVAADAVLAARWLADHDRDVQAAALREGARLRERADQLDPATPSEGARP